MTSGPLARGHGADVTGVSRGWTDWPGGLRARTGTLLALLLLAPVRVLAQAASAGPNVQDAPAPARETPWAVGLSLTGNFFPSGTQSDFVQPTLTVDHGWLHLEARYAYEALRTGSVWIGWNFAWGDSVTFALTPMFGVVFGLAKGVASGIEWDLSWGPLELTSTNEFVFDFANWGASDFNDWAELRVWPWQWLKLGVALTHTRAIQLSYPAQWGPLVGVKFWKINAAVYWMNPGGATDSYWSATLGINF